jgi:O-antigen ligase
MFKKIILYIRETDSLEIAWLLIYAAGLSYSTDTMANELSPSLGISNLLRMCFVASSFLIIAINLSRGIPYPRFNAVWIFLIYICIGLISTFWSVSPIKTLGKSLEILAPTLIVLLCANKANALYRLRRLFDWYIIVYSIIVLGHVIGVLFYPEIIILSRAGSWGISSKWFSSNSISVYSAILALIFLSRWGEAVYLRVQTRGLSRGLYLFGYLIFFPVCVFAHGRTAIGIAVLSTILVCLRIKLTFPKILLAVSIPFLVIFSGPIIEYLYRGQNIEQIKGLSGRVDLINLGLPYFLENPNIGYGFGVGSDYVFSRIGLSGLSGYEGTISSLHNGIIEVLLGTGILGFAVLSLSMIKAFGVYARGFLRGRDLDMVMIAIFIFSYTFVSGLGLGGWMNAHIAFYLVSITILSLKSQKELKNSL